MVLRPESRLGIQLNTFVRFLENTPTGDIRDAKNDEHWDSCTHMKVAYGALQSAVAVDQHNPLQIAPISRRQFTRVRETRLRSLYSFVKLNMVADLIDGYRRSHKSPDLDTKVMDIGYSFQPARRLLNSVWKKLDYTGVNLNSITHSDVLDITGQTNTPGETTHPPAEVALALDVLPELCKTPEAFNENLAKLSNLTAGSSLIVISMPQMNYLPGHKLGPVGHLLTMRGTQSRQDSHAKHVGQLCMEAVEKHFIVKRIIGIGFLSTLPGSLMRSRQNCDTNLLGKMCQYLCDRLFEYGAVKTIDLFLTRTLGKVPLFRGLCNGVLIVASPRQARISRVKF